MHSSSCFGCIKFDRAEPRGFELISSVVNDVIDLQGRLGYMKEGKRTKDFFSLGSFWTRKSSAERTENCTSLLMLVPSNVQL